MPGPNGKGSRVIGKAQAWVRRLDNSFFAGLTGGLPRLTTDLERGNDGILHFTNLQLYSPKLRLSGQGIRRKDGTFLIEARGTPGAIWAAADAARRADRAAQGRTDPRSARTRRSASATCGCSSIPIAQGFAYRASGQSRLGPFTSNGEILLPKGGRATIAIAALNVAGSTARGALRADPGGFTGALQLGGGGLERHARLLRRSTATSGSRRISRPTMLSVPGPPAVQRSRPAGSTARSCSPRDERRSTDVVAARGLQASGDSACAAHRQCAAGQRQRAGPRGACRARAARRSSSSRWPMSRPTGSA